MWGDGGRIYWGRKAGDAAEGVVVVFSEMSRHERRLKSLLDLYSSLGWSSLVCLSDFFSLSFPERATRLAHSALNELLKEVKIRPLPTVFAAFSGGSKGCLYKVLQLIEGKCEGQYDLDKYQLIRDCVCAQIYDSSPVDFDSDLGNRFTSHPTRVASWVAKAVASGMGTLFVSRVEAQRAEYWQSLQLSYSIGPILIFCSEDDESAPRQVVYDFAQRLQELGGDVRLVKWNKSSYVGLDEQYPTEYKASVIELLGKATVIHSQRRQQLNGEAFQMNSSNKISDPLYILDEAAVSSKEDLTRIAVDPSGHLFLPSAMEFNDTENSEWMQGKRKSESFQMQNASGMGAHGVLGQILFEACIPKNIEGWDIKPHMSLSRKRAFTSRWHGPFNPIKCIQRSKL